MGFHTTGGDNKDIEARVWENHGIYIRFLPPRAPEPNPTELVWGGMVKKCKALTSIFRKEVVRSD
jgi:transposase